MYKSIALITFGLVVNCTPSTSGLDNSVLDAVFGPSSPAQPTAPDGPSVPTKSVDSIIEEVSGTTNAPSSLNQESTVDVNDGDGKECVKHGKKGTCVTYYLCPNPEVTSDDFIEIDPVVPDEGDCPNYLHVCCPLRTVE